MSLKRIFITLVYTVLLATAVIHADQRPNIVFFIVDDQKRDFYTFLPDNEHPDVKGSVTPALDRLAQDGVVLSQLHVPSPVCIPSRFTALTGAYPSRAVSTEFAAGSWLFGYPWVGQNTRINDETITLPHRLQDAGYFTGAVGKNHVIDVDGYRRIRHDGDIKDPENIRILARNARLQKQAYHGAGFDFAERLYYDNIMGNGPRVLNPGNIDWITEGALNFIDEAAQKDQPFYLYFATTSPHGPYGMWDTGDRRATPEGMLKKTPDVQPSGQEIAKRLREAGYKRGDRHWKVAGDNMWTDDALAAVIEKLRETGELDNTIIIFFNDHGVESGKTTIYQGGMLTLGVVSGPEQYVKGGRLDQSLTSSVDFGETILNWANYEGNRKGIDGVDLSPVLLGESNSVRDAVFGEIGMTRSVRVGDWKYLAIREPDYLKTMPLEIRQKRIDDMHVRMKNHGRKPFKNKATDPFAHIGYLPGGWDNTWAAMRDHPAYFDVDQLYNLTEDPHEKNNLASDPRYADILAELKAELTKHLANMPGKFGEF